jgi:large subunit ribosomal protein L13
MTGTYTVKASEISRKWYIIDAENKPLGRIATEAARILRGKHKPTFTPYMDTGDYVIIINADKVILTGNKLQQKLYRHHSLYPGGLKEIKYKDLLEKQPEKAFMIAIAGMLPKNSLGRAMIKKLKVYKGTEHNHEAQKPEKWEFSI